MNTRIKMIEIRQWLSTYRQASRRYLQKSPELNRYTNITPDFIVCWQSTTISYRSEQEQTSTSERQLQIQSISCSTTRNALGGKMLPGFLTRLSRNRYWWVRLDTGQDQIILGPETRWIRQASHRIDGLWTLDDSEGPDRPDSGLAGHRWYNRPNKSTGLASYNRHKASSGQEPIRHRVTTGIRVIRPNSPHPAKHTRPNVIRPILLHSLLWTADMFLGSWHWFQPIYPPAHLQL